MKSCYLIIIITAFYTNNTLSLEFISQNLNTSKDDFAEGLLGCVDYTGAASIIAGGASCGLPIIPGLFCMAGATKTTLLIASGITLPTAVACVPVSLCCISAHIYGRLQLRRVCKITPLYEQL